jgi:hypothetical protein
MFGFTKKNIFIISLLLLLLLLIIIYFCLSFYIADVFVNESIRNLPFHTYPNGTFVLNSNGYVKAIPCEELFKLFPIDLGKGGLHTNPKPMGDGSELWISYVVGNKNMFTLESRGFLFNVSFMGISDEPRCFMALGTFIESVNNVTK